MSSRAPVRWTHWGTLGESRETQGVWGERGWRAVVALRGTGTKSEWSTERAGADLSELRRNENELERDWEGWMES